MSVHDPQQDEDNSDSNILQILEISYTKEEIHNFKCPLFGEFAANETCI